jgi:uncharacterized protein YdhG (YjbR/CyaY superfamily)
MTTPSSIDEYIAAYPPKVRAILQKVRRTIAKAAPDAEERIAYRMPSFAQDGALVYFGGFTHHVGLFPPVRDAALKREAAPYAGPKGNLQFQYAEPIPYDLIARIVQARVRENAARGAAKKSPAKRASTKRAR